MTGLCVFIKNLKEKEMINFNSRGMLLFAVQYSDDKKGEFNVAPEALEML